MTEVFLFTDGSAHPQLKIGFGAMLLVGDIGITFDEAKLHLRVHRFDATSSAKLEIQTLLWSLSQLNDYSGLINIYTDSQNILQLPIRRNSFEQNGYKNKTGALLNNHQLYKAFFAYSDKMNLKLNKIKGHQAFKHKSKIEMLFSIVDKGSRKALRKELAP